MHCCKGAQVSIRSCCVFGLSNVVLCNKWPGLLTNRTVCVSLHCHCCVLPGNTQTEHSFNWCIAASRSKAQRANYLWLTRHPAAFHQQHCQCYSAAHSSGCVCRVFLLLRVLHVWGRAQNDIRAVRDSISDYNANAVCDHSM